MDDSETSGRALEHSLENHPDVGITVLHVVGEPSPMWGAATGLALADDLEEAAEEMAKQVFGRARAIADEHDVGIRTDFHLGRPGKAIAKRAEDYDLAVIGSHSGSLADGLFVGNVAGTVFRWSPVPVTVVQ